MASAKVSTKVVKSNVTPLVVPQSKLTHSAEEKAVQTKFVEAQVNNDRIAQLRAEQKRIAEELKELRASKPNKLEAEIARQINTPSKDLIASLRACLRGRMAYGQAFDEAVDAILTQCRTLLEAIPEDQRVRKFPEPPTRKAKVQ